MNHWLQTRYKLQCKKNTELIHIIRIGIWRARENKAHTEKLYEINQMGVEQTNKAHKTGRHRSKGAIDKIQIRKKKNFLSDEKIPEPLGIYNGLFGIYFLINYIKKFK